MAKTNKTAGNIAKSGGNNTTLLLLAGAGVAAYFLLQGSGDSAATDRATNEAAGAGAYDNTPATPRPPTSTPSSLPSSIPSSVPQTGGAAAGTLIDRYGVPHLSPTTMAQGNAMDGSKGATYKTLSDTYGLFWTEVNALLEYDYTVSGDHTYQQVYDWYAADPGRMRGWIDYYNQHNPNLPPIRPRVG